MKTRKKHLMEKSKIRMQKRVRKKKDLMEKKLLHPLAQMYEKDAHGRLIKV